MFIVGLVGAALGLLSLFLPYLSVMGFVSASALSGGGLWGILMLAGCICCGVFLFLQKPMFALIGAAVYTISDILLMLAIRSSLNDYAGMGVADVVSNGIGFYLCIVSAVLMLVGTIKMFLDSRNSGGNSFGPY